MNQTYIPGTAPPPATGPWTAELETLESGTYLGETGHGELGIYGYSNALDFEEDEDLDECVWLNMQTLEPADPPKLVARIYRQKGGQG